MTMTKNIKSIFDPFTSNPKRLFLIDGSGAFLTAFLLGVVLTRFEGDFGMPRKILYALSMLACFYAVYSMACYFWVGKNWRLFLKAIAIANLIYCCLTLGLIISFYQSLTMLGFIYFTGELLVIGGLICIELLTVSERDKVHSDETIGHFGFTRRHDDTTN